MIDFEQLKAEWPTIASAPFTFVFIAVVVFGLAYAASRWRYTGIIESLRERLAAKDQQLDEYRERLHLTPAHGSEYAKLSHRELQSEALKLVTSLREWQAAQRTEESQLTQQQWTVWSRATSDTEKRQLWDQQMAQSRQSSDSMKNDYDAKFKVKAIVLRDELLTRVQRSHSNPVVDHSYEHPTNAFGIAMVVDDLERLARLLH